MQQRIVVKLTASDGKDWCVGTNILPFTAAQAYFMGRRTEDFEGNLRQPIVKVELDGNDCKPIPVSVVTSSLPPKLSAIVKPGAVNAIMVASAPPPVAKKYSP